jgi:hypothetical protein
MVYRMDLSAAGRTGTSWERVLVWIRDALEEKVEKTCLASNHVNESSSFCYVARSHTRHFDRG